MQTVIQLIKNRHFSKILKLLSMIRKRVGIKKAKDCNPEKHLYNCAVIVLGEKVPHTKYSLTRLLSCQHRSH